MELNFSQLKSCLDKLKKDTNPKWGTMSSTEMLCHCNNFIEVSIGKKKISFTTKILGKIFGKLYLKYLISIDFDINRFLKNSKTLKAFKSFPISINFENQKDKLIKNIDMLDKIYSKQITHQLYGKIKTKLFKRLMFFHTKYHFNQFSILNQC